MDLNFPGSQFPRALSLLASNLVIAHNDTSVLISKRKSRTEIHGERAKQKAEDTRPLTPQPVDFGLVNGAVFASWEFLIEEDEEDCAVEG
ncbi:hypothetical protein N7490_008136 [Penicillium lividum]|nr:hypothetical protein N7490_008136 [Penicillium lividum]